MNEQEVVPAGIPDVATDSTQPDTAPSQEQKMSKRDFEIAMRRAYKERNEKLKQNKVMLEEMELEVRYWKAQSDLLKYRFEKMDYYLRNLDLEPKYLAAIEEQRIKEEQAAGIGPDQKQLLS